MTRDKALKKSVRTRMVTTGSSYTHALAEVRAGRPPAAAGLVPPPEVGALARALNGVLEPELLFGIGGGAGFGRFVYGPIVTLLTRITTTENRRDGFVASVCARLGVPYTMQASSKPEAVLRRLTNELAQGRVPLLWVNGEGLPWDGPVISYQAVAVVDLDAGTALVHDTTEHILPVERLVAAARVAGFGYRTLVVQGPPHRDVAQAAGDGISAHVQQMREGFGPKNVRAKFGMAGLQGWASRVAEDNASGPGMARLLTRRGGGPAMRLAQAEFFALIGRREAADLAREAAGAWSRLSLALDRESASAADVAEVIALEEAVLRTVEQN